VFLRRSGVGEQMGAEAVAAVAAAVSEEVVDEILSLAPLFSIAFLS